LRIGKTVKTVLEVQSILIYGEIKKKAVDQYPSTYFSSCPSTKTHWGCVFKHCTASLAADSSPCCAAPTHGSGGEALGWMNKEKKQAKSMNLPCPRQLTDLPCLLLD